MIALLFKNFVLELLYYYIFDHTVIHTVTGETSQDSRYNFIAMKPEN